MVQSFQRWEWRTFARELDPIAVALPAAFEAIDETLIVCAASETRAAIRNNTIAVDVLADRSGGLEFWQRVLTSAFPLCQRDVRDVLRQYPLTPPVLYRPEYSPFEFVTDVAACTDGLRVVGVRLVDRLVSIDDCTLERATLSIAGTTLQSLAVSSTDPQSVRRLLARLKLDRLENRNVVALVKGLLAMPVAGRIPRIVGDFSHAN